MKPGNFTKKLIQIIYFILFFYNQHTSLSSQGHMSLARCQKTATTFLEIEVMLQPHTKNSRTFTMLPHIKDREKERKKERF